MHGEIQKVVVTSVVRRHFCILSGAPRACADFYDPTVVSRFKGLLKEHALILAESSTSGVPRDIRREEPSGVRISVFHEIRTTKYEPQLP